MSEDQIAKLERLADLRERGLLSDTEFERAKRNLIAGIGASSPDPEAAPSRGLGAKEWMATGAATLAILLLGGYWLSIGDSQADTLNEQTFDLAGENEIPPAEPTAAGADLCGSPENYAQIKDMVFERAVEVMGGDPVPLNTLKKTVSVRMELPVVSAIDDKVQRTDCTGRLVIDLPPGTREAFDGEKSLEADLEYSFQPAADGNGYVIRAEGFGYMVQRLIGAASLVSAQRLASMGGPQLQRTFNPSFDCGRALTNVERMICQDEQLSTADRVVSAKFAALKESLPPLAWRDVRDAQRTFLKERGICADTACVRGAYVTQWQTLKAIEQTVVSAPEPVPSAEEASIATDEAVEL